MFSQIPFPVIDFCPDLNYHVLLQYLDCLKFQICDGIDRQALMTMMTTIHFGFQMCNGKSADWIENNFGNELLWSDYKNMSVSDHLQYFLNRNWTEEISFCMDGELSDEPMEVMVDQGICFILNAEEKIYTQR